MSGFLKIKIFPYFIVNGWMFDEFQSPLKHWQHLTQVMTLRVAICHLNKMGSKHQNYTFQSLIVLGRLGCGLINLGNRILERKTLTIKNKHHFSWKIIHINIIFIGAFFLFTYFSFNLHLDIGQPSFYFLNECQIKEMLFESCKQNKT